MGCCGNKSSSLPSLAKQAVTASKALGRVAKAIVSNQPLEVDAVTLAARLSICRLNDCSRKHPGSDFLLCLKCGCGLNGTIRRKAHLTTEDCPQGLWTKL